MCVTLPGAYHDDSCDVLPGAWHGDSCVTLPGACNDDTHFVHTILVNSHRSAMRQVKLTPIFQMRLSKWWAKATKLVKGSVLLAWIW